MLLPINAIMFALSLSGDSAVKAGSAVTLKDVARLAEVSEITVSRVLRDNGPISPATRARVMEAVQWTGYVRNSVAGSLASARSNLVGVVLPSLSNNVFAEVMAGIDAALANSGFQPIVGVSDYGKAREEQLVSSMLAWKPAALILTGLDHSHQTSRLLAGAGIRIIEIMEIDGNPVDVAIGLSHRDAGLATARHLVERGYRRFGFVGHDLDRDARAAARYRGLCDGVAMAGLAPVAISILPGPSSVQLGTEGLRALLASEPGCDVAVFSNDDMAVGGVFACMADGIALKRQLGIFGFNGLDLGQALPAPLSTIRSPRMEIGQIAVQTFLDQRERPAAPTVINSGFQIIEGQTA